MVLALWTLGFTELLLILFILVLIFGANRIAGLGRGVGQAIRGFKDEVQDRERSGRDSA